MSEMYFIMQEALFEIYNKPQIGGSLQVFQGSRRHMTGSGFFGTLMRIGLPILKNVGKRVLGAGVRGASRFLAGEPLGKSMVGELVDESVEMVKDGVKSVRGKIRQSGSGMKRKTPINKNKFILKRVRKI